MHTQVETQPGRGVKVHDIVRSAEKWRGIFLIVKDKSHSGKIQAGLEMILEEEGYLPPKNEGDIIYSKGAYDDETVRKLEKYLGSHSGLFKTEPVIAEGSYDDFLGDRWLNKLKAKY